MQFSSKIVTFAVIPAVLFVVGIVNGIAALISAQGDFEHYVGSEQAVRTALTDMYANGLQMGQALRNIALDPQNPTAYKNMETAQKAYADAFDQAQIAAKGCKLEGPLARLVPLRQQHARVQDNVLSALRGGADVQDMITQEETPAWHQLRAELLEQGKYAKQISEETYQHFRDRARIATIWSIILAAIAILVSLVLNIGLRRTLRLELGGELTAAREALQSVAEGNLCTPIDNHGSAQSLMGTVVKMREALHQLVMDVRNSAAGIASASAEIASGNNDLSARTEGQATALDEISASMGTLSDTVNQNATSAVQASHLASSANVVAVQGGQVVGEVVDTMRGIHESSRRISDIIQVIDGIAFQTNILALNAAVEAARAGEQGRGFAVVASEVRSLAVRSAEAAKQIKTLIHDSVEKVESGTQLVDKAGSTMQEVVQSIQRVAEIMGAISQASSEQSQGVRQVGEALGQLDQTTQQNAALVEEMAAATDSLKSQSRGLVDTVAQFQLTNCQDKMGASSSAALHPLTPAPTRGNGGYAPRQTHQWAGTARLPTRTS
ncbi:methyl-accepting chemotaxis protein [Candidatus Symbiobacter mobilis]|uniref:Methyl-accepting chemotaxis protein n=1 Tax=Candidatus Symbiobacter mobilis CR TaxID=946483 RepID=U5N680_9BURK|nr:methyl-accepting chemotaxis protein [Candidatus Symbiobacter mobilis]AGX86805.1 methyl-accepting chemotaxis protein [Candidatus Symbiobacter mobilis CR]